MKEFLASAQQAYQNFTRKAADFLDRDSVRRKLDIGKAAGLASVTALCIGYAGAGLFLGGGLIFAAPAFFFAAMVSAAHLEDAVKKVIHGEQKATWTNDAGQTVESTVSQKMDLEKAQDKIYAAMEWAHRQDAECKADSENSARRIADKFARVAARVSIVNDIQPSTGKFIFARRGPVLPLGV